MKKTAPPIWVVSVVMTKRTNDSTINVQNLLSWHTGCTKAQAINSAKATGKERFPEYARLIVSAMKIQPDPTA